MAEASTTKLVEFGIEAGIGLFAELVVGLPEEVIEWR
jgi:hypothetical protein